MISISKTLSYILRHKPEDFKLYMDQHGWVEVQPLVDALNINIPTLVSIVKEDTKGRYQFNSDNTFIRATQGHSVPISVDLPEFNSDVPVIYHGTAKRFLDSILEDGLKRMSRVHVHLSLDADTALDVGKRHGSPVVLSIDYQQMKADGIKLLMSDNGVILTDYVAPKYIKVI